MELREVNMLVQGMMVISASGPWRPQSRVLPNQPASRVHGLRHLWICLQEFGDTRTMVEM